MQKTEALALAKEYKEALLAAEIPFEKVVLFGSFSKGDPHEQSDIDLAVIGRPFKSSRREEALALRRLRRPISYRIHPIWTYSDKMENKYSTLAKEISVHGIEIE